LKKGRSDQLSADSAAFFVFMGNTVRQLFPGATHFRDRLKAAGGKWNPEEKIWHVPYDLMRGTALEKRILVEEGKQRRRK
jgi:hypothetical protein